MSFVQLKVGDKVTREMEGFKGGKNWEADGHIIEVSETVITCKLFVKGHKIAQFHRDTGVSVLGESYGWLRSKQAVNYDG
ncbi:MAG: hypothetical protein GY928_34205 [Colwellia sp.]|nr:hypothetical protein [Colwellia sp.]